MEINEDKDLRALLGDDLDDEEPSVEATEFSELDPRRDWVPRVEIGYTEDWIDVSWRTRESVNWVCEQCGKSFVHNRAKLHVHHRDGDKRNNLPDNLEVLCHACHERTHGYKIG